MTQEPLYCATHPKIETNLRCGKCGKLICPKCMVYTPVGARCPDCAQVRRLPIYDVSAANYLSALGAGMAMALVAGVVWSFIPGFVSIWVPLLIGYLVGEGVSRAANRKRSRGLQVIAGTMVFASFIVLQLFRLFVQIAASGRELPMEVVSSAAIRSVVSGLLNPYLLVVLALGIYLAVTRTR
ncbi:MAG: hypothetical protein EPO21_23585 [Chloroflexota bacterium]|nr:MAG: hypothetical protein EPO21_23585 [Chloroflexota bacterium]